MASSLTFVLVIILLLVVVMPVRVLVAMPGTRPMPVASAAGSRPLALVGDRAHRGDGDQAEQPGEHPLPKECTSCDHERTS